MAIGAQMPQDILRYKAKFVANLTVRQCVFYGIGTVVGLTIFFTAAAGLPIKIRGIACACGCIPFYLWGSINPFGQPLEKVIGPFIKDNILAPPIRKKEIHFPEIEAMQRINPKEAPAKPSKDYPEIK